MWRRDKYGHTCLVAARREKVAAFLAALMLSVAVVSFRNEAARGQTINSLIDPGGSMAQILLPGGERVDTPVPEGQGQVNPHVRELRQGDGRYGTPRIGDIGPHQHNGIDLTAPVGSPVQAPISGQVVWSGYTKDFGNSVRIRDAKGRVHILAHLSGSHQIELDTYVRAGQRVGDVGRTGNLPPAAASHVHYEVRDGKNPVPLVSTPTQRPFSQSGFQNSYNSQAGAKASPQSAPKVGPAFDQNMSPGAPTSGGKWVAQVEGGNPKAALSDGTYITLGRFNTPDEASAAEKRWDAAHPGNLRLTRELQEPTASALASGSSLSPNKEVARGLLQSPRGSQATSLNVPAHLKNARAGIGLDPRATSHNKQAGTRNPSTPKLSGGQPSRQKQIRAGRQGQQPARGFGKSQTSGRSRQSVVPKTNSQFRVAKKASASKQPIRKPIAPRTGPGQARRTTGKSRAVNAAVTRRPSPTNRKPASHSASVRHSSARRR
jgi:hypothetical protein